MVQTSGLLEIGQEGLSSVCRMRIVQVKQRNIGRDIIQVKRDPLCSRTTVLIFLCVKKICLLLLGDRTGWS